LLEFGEDYRNDLDSLSDCPSSLSADLRGFRPHHLPKRSPPKRPKGFGMADRSALTELRLLDSDSDVDDLVHVVETSASQFTIALNTFHKVVNTNRLEPSQYVSKCFLTEESRIGFVALLGGIETGYKGTD
jgi:hypothetical protein